MKNKIIPGIILILIGAAILAYGHFSYQSRETVLEWTKDKKMDLVKIDATGDIAEITERTMKALEEE